MRQAVCKWIICRKKDDKKIINTIELIPEK